MEQGNKEALLYDKLSGGAVRCRVCQWECVIRPGKLGVCRVRQNDDGTLVVLNYGLVSSATPDPVEKKPLFHFFPATKVYSLGTVGCNFHCKHCQNWEISCGKIDRQSLKPVSPAEAVSLAGQHSCRGIAWTYNEPAIWFEYTLDCARIAKENNLYTVYVTNGYITGEGLDTIGKYLDAYRVDIKGFSDTCYSRLAGIPRWRGILDVAKRAQDRWGMHVEVVTNIVPTLNDDDEQLKGIAGWIRDNLGELTPWHITRFYPDYQLMNLPPTPIETLEHAYDLGRKAGLKFVYLGNVPGNDRENTVCYQCGRLLVRRIGYGTTITGVNGSRCNSCGAPLNIKDEGWKRLFVD
ncbi:MAG: AmmeMemoRadiSam system radical SAM enzyme [Dehalococcoidia bacterium]|nr:AmmeMemoRadiSam system radical SAM enzyme [Dehalococcoidia bacterium]